MTRPINAAGIALLKEFERGPEGGPALTPYRCPAGKLTLGYGHVVGEALASLKITPAIAEAWLAKDAALAAGEVATHVTVPLNDNQFAALACFVFNIGRGNFEASTLLRQLDLGCYADVPAQLERWDKAGGRILAGLDRRRAAEVALWSTPVA